MPLVHVNPVAGTFDHLCDPGGRACGLVRRGLLIDPAAGDLIVTPGALLTRPCPRCGSVEAFNRALLPHDAGEAPQPDSLVGTVYPDVGPAGSVVTEHWVGGHADPVRREQARLIRALQRHPALARHAPLHEDWLAAQDPPRRR